MSDCHLRAEVASLRHELEELEARRVADVRTLELEIGRLRDEIAQDRRGVNVLRSRVNSSEWAT